MFGRFLRGTRIMAVLAGFAGLLVSGAAEAASRVAIVIGNGGYRAMKSLNTPRKGAEEVAAALKRLGFEVTVGTDLTLDGMRKLIRETKPALDKAYVRVIYFAGRGISPVGEDYLLPTDAAPRAERDLNNQAVALGQLVESVGSGDEPAVLFVDASRTKLVQSGLAASPARFRRPLIDLRKSGRKNRMVVFSAWPGTEAADGEPGALSPFTAALLKHLETPEIPVSELTSRVRKDLLLATAGDQSTWEDSSLTDELYLAGRPKEKPKKPLVGDWPAMLTTPLAVPPGMPPGLGDIEKKF